MSNNEPISVCPAIDCADLTGDFLEPYADISGPGVLVGFIGTAYLVLLLVIVNYFLSFDPNEDPFKGHATTHEDAETPRWRPNPIDQRLITWLRKLPLLMPSTRKRLRAAFDEAIIIMCDIQIITGIGILSSGYILLQCGLDASHWQTVVYLGWFSTVTHLSGLNILRGYLSTTPWAKYVRVLLMSALLVLVVVGLVPTGFFNHANFSSQAICYFNQSYGYWRHDTTRPTPIDRPLDFRPVEMTSEWQAMVMSVILLIFGFLSRSFKLFRPLSTAFRAHMRTPVSRFMQRILQRLAEPRSSVSVSWRNKLKLRVVTRPAVAAFLMLRLSCDLFGSTLLEVYWLLVILLWGTVKILSARNSIRTSRSDVSLAEEQWTFGQILPVFLLFGPLFSMAGIFASHMTKTTSYALGQYGREEYMAAMNATESQTRLYSRPVEGMSFDTLEFTAQEDIREPLHASVAPATTNRNTSEVDLMYLKDYGNAPWLPICAAVPFLGVFATTIILFAAIFNFGESFEPLYTLYEVWIQDFNMIIVLLISYPCACATTIRFGLGMNLNGGWRKFGFFWLCANIYAAYFTLTIMFQDYSWWFRLSSLIITSSLYICHVLISLMRISKD